MIVWTEPAQGDLNAIADYIGTENPAAAEAVLDRIQERANVLDTHPEIGRRGRRAHTRELVLADYPYTIVYTRTSRGVTIVRVLHQHQQWP